MKISLNWLQDFVTLKVTDPQEIGKRVTAGVAEVDDVEILGGLLDKCCVGKILSLKKHPNADRLNLCEVQTDKGVKKIVCGGTNLRVGMRVAVANVGAKVRWHGTEMMTLAKTGIRGEESEGMICTSSELDLTGRIPQKDEREVIDLGDGDLGVGESLKEYLGLDDVVLHIDNHAITHRADLFSHIGFAREFVALGLATWKKQKTSAPAFPKTPHPVKCIVDRKDLVPRYSSVLIDVAGLGETPKWMRTRLEATGWRCVSLPVDITNYVAMETGMPLHSFDADDIRGDFHMRAAKEGEKITTLDDVERVLPEGAVVLSDREGIFDLMGIMGGLRSSTKESTRHVYLHSAIVDPVAIRKAIIATGHRTDASTVYEKGIPRISAHLGLFRAIELFLELVPGAKLASRLEEWGDNGKGKPISLSLERANSMLGIDIPEKKIVKILEDLEFDVKKGSKASMTVTPPLHRLGDIRGQHDLIEEIGRIYGYKDIPTELPAARIDPPKRDMRTHRLRDQLKERGYIELVPISLVGDALLKKSGFDPSVAVEVRNPIGEELKLLHTSTLPGLFEHAQRNLLYAGSMLKTFHLARVFKKGQAEHLELGMLLADLQKPAQHRALIDVPFLHLKTDVCDVLRNLGYELDVAVAGELPAVAHPGRYAELLIRAAAKPERSDGEAGPFTPVGRIFEVHPSVASQFDLPPRATAVIVDLSAVLAVAPAVTVASPVPQFPSIVYDVTLTGRRLTEQVGDLIKRMRGSHEYLESVTVKDLYSEKDSYNLTLTFTYRAGERTLTEQEVKPVHEKILAGVDKD
ncbi:MAG: phenylalanine--tRNA ligase subunit beta [Candidatus Peribacteraceae bacterium]|nr:phenylalanine--tRNA ligase subunit beta [Candidatus Peribacteraceae bacterium]